MASCSPSISIFVEPPADELCAPLDFGDGPTMMTDPPFDTTGYAQFLSGPLPDLWQGFSDGSQNHNYKVGGRGSNNLLVPPGGLNLAYDCYPTPLEDMDDYPFKLLSYSMPRSVAEDCSPYSGTLSEELSPSSSPSPSIHSGALSPLYPSADLSHSSLSPTFLGDLQLPFTQLNLESNYQPPSAFRLRSYSVTERTVAPSDTWYDPAHSRVRTAPPTISPLPDDTFVDYTVFNSVSECNPHQIGGEIVSGMNEGCFSALDDVLHPGVSPAMNSDHAEYHPDAGSGILLRPDPVDLPRLHRLEMESEPRIPTTSFHRRGHSDSSAFLSPTSPIDHRGGRTQHRKASSVSACVRHAPYPASAPSTPEAGFRVTDLAGGYAARCQYSGTSSFRPKLSIDVAQPLEDNQVSASQQSVFSMPPGGDQVVGSSYVPDITVKNEWSPANRFSQISMVEQLSPDSAVSSASSSGWKDVVGSKKIVDASTARRKRESKYVCELPGCGQTFTAKHNWTYHTFAHSGERHFPCSKCGDCFTTPGVANRHRNKCDGVGGNTKRRRPAPSTPSTSSLVF